MKNYFQKILSLFARHNYSEQTNQMFYRWLVDNEYEKEKKYISYNIENT